MPRDLRERYLRWRERRALRNIRRCLGVPDDVSDDEIRERVARLARDLNAASISSHEATMGLLNLSLAARAASRSLKEVSAGWSEAFAERDPDDPRDTDASL